MCNSLMGILGFLWHESYCLCSAARVSLFMHCGTNPIVYILWHEAIVVPHRLSTLSLLAYTSPPPSQEGG